MRRVGQVRRRDANERAIVEALQAVGCDVTRVSGEGAPDLLVRRSTWAAGSCLGLEVKGRTGTRTKAQQGSQWPIVRTIGEALLAVGI